MLISTEKWTLIKNGQSFLRVDDIGRFKILSETLKSRCIIHNYQFAFERFLQELVKNWIHAIFINILGVLWVCVLQYFSM